MLSGFAEKNARLTAFVDKNRAVRSGPSLLAELEKERSRIARELHAGAGQPLAGIKLHLEILNECTAQLPDSIWQNPVQGESAREAIGRLQTLAEQALGQVRALSHRLHPPEWQQKTLVEALESLLESSGLGGRLVLRGDFQPLPEEPSHAVKVQMYRCAQECLSNVIRHSGATEAIVELSAEDRRLLLTVTDNGHGFDITAKSSGIGLKAIEENAASMGGTASIASAPNGTKIRVSLPFSED